MGTLHGNSAGKPVNIQYRRKRIPNSRQRLFITEKQCGFIKPCVYFLGGAKRMVEPLAQQARSHRRFRIIDSFKQGKSIRIVMQVLQQFKIFTGGIVHHHKIGVAVYFNTRNMRQCGSRGLIQILQQQSCRR